MKVKLLLLLLIVGTAHLFAQKIDTKHLSLNLKFNWQKRQAIGTAEITFSPLTATDKFVLDAGNLTIIAVFLNNKLVKYNYDGGDEKDNVAIVADRICHPNETLILKIEYQTNYENKADPNAIWGSFGKGLRFQEPTSTTPLKRKQIWSNGEPNNNKYWFPCNEDIADIHTTEFIATVEKPLMVISNGNLVKTIDNINNTRTFHYKTNKPFPNYLVSFVVGEYDDAIQNSNGIAMHNFGYPHEIKAVKATTELLPDMLQFLDEKTGYKYPFSQYSQVVVQDYPFPGLVGQNNFSILSDNYIDDYGVHKDFKYLWDGVAVQSLANQWFGNLLMPLNWDDYWLNSAFAQYFAGHFTEYSNGKSEYLTYILPFEKSSVFADWSAGNKHPIVTSNYKDVAAFTTDSYSKYRGAMVLRMLQKEVGEANWWKAMQLYVKTNAYKQVSTKDFKIAIEKTTGKSYQWFFDQWIYKIGLPKFEVTKNYDAAKKQLIIYVKQIQTIDSVSDFEQVNYFGGIVEIEIDNKIEQVNIEPKAENIFEFSMPQAPSFVNFDYEETWICEIKFKKSSEEYFQQLAKSKDVLAKQKALDKLVEMANVSTATAAFKEKTVAAFKNEIISKSYWRYRFYAIASLRKIITVPYNYETIAMLLKLIKTETSWLKTSAIFTLGNTNDEKYLDIYLEALNDESDRVINAAAIAIGKTKSLKAYDILLNLESKPSWKNQNRISAINGLEQLKDIRAVDYTLKCLEDNQSARWYLATPVWDYPFAAANALVSLGKANLGYPILLARFKTSLQENDINDIFQNVQLIDILKDERAKEMYYLLKEKFKGDAGLMETVTNYEKQFLESIKK
jgi:aminopeptidase N